MVGTGYVGPGDRHLPRQHGQRSDLPRHRPGEDRQAEPGRLADLRAGAGRADHAQRQGRAAALHHRQAARRTARRRSIFICVGTPPDETGHADLAARLRRRRRHRPGDRARRPGGGDARAAPRSSSSSPPCPSAPTPLVEAESRKQTGKPFHMASNPEFLKEGAAINDFTQPDRVVIGVEDKGTGDRLRDLYEPFVRQGNPIFVMDIPSRGDGQVRRQRHARDEDQLHQRDRQPVRGLRRRHRRGPPRHVLGPAHRQPVPLSRPGLRRLVLPQGCAGLHFDGSPGRDRRRRALTRYTKRTCGSGPFLPKNRSPLRTSSRR